MPKFNVQVSVVGGYGAEVEADTPEEAGRLARDEFDPRATDFKGGLEIVSVEPAEDGAEGEAPFCASCAGTGDVFKETFPTIDHAIEWIERYSNLRVQHLSTKGVSYTFGVRDGSSLQFTEGFTTFLEDDGHLVVTSGFCPPDIFGDDVLERL